MTALQNIFSSLHYGPRGWWDIDLNLGIKISKNYLLYWFVFHERNSTKKLHFALPTPRSKRVVSDFLNTKLLLLNASVQHFSEAILFNSSCQLFFCLLHLFKFNSLYFLSLMNFVAIDLISFNFFFLLIYVYLLLGLEFFSFTLFRNSLSQQDCHITSNLLK